MKKIISIFLALVIIMTAIPIAPVPVAGRVVSDTDDEEEWQCVEENDTAWHCGAKSYKHSECRNSNSIGVELCVKKDKNGKWYYTEKTKKAAIQLFAYLMDKYGIDESHVLRHFDVTGKICGEPDVRSENKVWSTFKSTLDTPQSGD